MRGESSSAHDTAMNILLSEKPSLNGYIESLLTAYQRAGHAVICDPSNFLYSDFVPDVLHIHWPERITYWHQALQGMSAAEQVARAAERLTWYKARGTKIVQTIHNLVPHATASAAGADAALACCLAQADVIVHHCQASVRETLQLYPAAGERANIVCRHGDYLLQFRQADPQRARRRLGIPLDAFVVLSFGRQRAYKNADFALQVFNALKVPRKFLLVAGNFDFFHHRGTEVLRLKARNWLRQRMLWRDRKYVYRDIKDAELPEFIAASDVFFLGQTRALNSGQLALAATFSKPVVYPQIGCFAEAMDAWIGESYTAGDAAGAVAALDRIKLRWDAVAGQPDNSAWLARNSWDAHVAGILEALAAFR